MRAQSSRGSRCPRTFPGFPSETPLRPWNPPLPHVLRPQTKATKASSPVSGPGCSLGVGMGTDPLEDAQAPAWRQGPQARRPSPCALPFHSLTQSLSRPCWGQASSQHSGLQQHKSCLLTACLRTER